MTQLDSDRLDYDQLLELAVGLARNAGAVARDMRTEAITSVATKSSPNDLVTKADDAAERIVVDGIIAARPTDAVVGEEGTSRDGSTGITWYVDPIDGTTNYVYGIPAYSVSIAIDVDDRTEIGVVYNPVSDELYTARRGAGSHLNGRPITVNDHDDLAVSLIGTGFSPRPALRNIQAGIALDVLPRIRDYRRFGSAALDLCSVAAGRLDGFYEAGLNVWDYAAGRLLVTEAGGVCRLLPAADRHGPWLVAGPPLLVDRLQDVVQSAVRRLG